MPIPSSEFSHFYKDCLKDLELHKSQNQNELNNFRSIEGHSLAQLKLYEEYDRVLNDVIWKLSNSNKEREIKPDPERAFIAGLSAISIIEHFRFLLDNLLEGAKGGMSVQNMLRDYKPMETISFDVSNLEEESDANKQSLYKSNYGLGRVIRQLLKRLKKCSLTVMELVAHAIKASSKLVAIKPKPSIGLSGPFPTFSLGFDLEAESMTIYELFQDLKVAFSDY